MTFNLGHGRAGRGRRDSSQQAEGDELHGWTAAGEAPPAVALDHPGPARVEVGGQNIHVGDDAITFH